jgi:hypothetical protein
MLSCGNPVPRLGVTKLSTFTVGFALRPRCLIHSQLCSHGTAPLQCSATVGRDNEKLRSGPAAD